MPIANLFNPNRDGGGGGRGGVCGGGVGGSLVKGPPSEVYFVCFSWFITKGGSGASSGRGLG